MLAQVHFPNIIGFLNKFIVISCLIVSLSLFHFYLEDVQKVYSLLSNQKWTGIFSTGPDINSLGIAGHMVSAATSQLCCGAKEAIDTCIHSMNLEGYMVKELNLLIYSWDNTGIFRLCSYHALNQRNVCHLNKTFSVSSL